MQKFRIKFLRKFEKYIIEITRVNFILITKSIILQLFTLILYGVGVRCDRSQFSVLNPFIEKFLKSKYQIRNNVKVRKLQIRERILNSTLLKILFFN